MCVLWEEFTDFSEEFTASVIKEMKRRLVQPDYLMQHPQTQPNS
jgi:hypothetical protein